MKVFGLDFTSSPSAGKRLTLAHCEFRDGIMTVERLEGLNTATEGDFSKIRDWLAGAAGYGDEWIAGIDFPFGLPIGAVEHFRWWPKNKGGCVARGEVLDCLYRDCPSLAEFQDKIESWKRKDKKNNQVKVHIKRQADQLAGSTVSSPLKVRDNPPVGSMFYAGARLLKEAGVCAYPVNVTECKRRVVEAYPALAVNRFVGEAKYKDQAGSARKEKAEGTREEILRQLADTNLYGVRVRFRDESDHKACVSDNAGDKLDSILCAVQAAWASLNHWGLPDFSLPCLRDTVALEGWIADPALCGLFT
jgi:hypothetical protein